MAQLTVVYWRHIPAQVIVGPRSIANGEVELKDRKSGARETLSIEAAINKMTSAG